MPFDNHSLNQPGLVAPKDSYINTSSTSSINPSSPSMFSQGDMSYAGSKDERSETVLFVDQGITKSSQPQPFSVCPPLNNMSERHEHSIAAFLRRPYRLGEYDIVAATSYVTSLSLANLFALPPVSDKISNFRYYRATACYRMVVNASRFASGRLVLCHTPYNSILTADRQITLTPSPQKLTSYPFVEVDFGSSESAILRIPYCAFTPWETIANTSWSEVHLQVLNTLRGPNAGETASVTIFAWLEDLELSIPTAAGGLDDEPQDKSKFIISPALRRISDLASGFTSAPLIGPYAEGVYWASSLASKAASLFGFSKPPNVCANTAISNVPSRGFTQCEGSSEAVVLGLRPSNTISVHPSFHLSSGDPMSFHSFLSRAQLNRRLSWTTTTLIGTNLLDQLVDEFFSSDSTFLSGLSDFYYYYRGGVVVRLSAVKNAFYSGRLWIGYTPTGNAPSSFDPSCAGIVWDIQENKEIIFHIPFIALTRFNYLGLANTGRLFVQVLNPLRTDSTLPNEITINMYSIGASDVSYAVPKNGSKIYSAGLTDGDSAPTSALDYERNAIRLLDVPNSDCNSEAAVMGEPTFTLKDIVKRLTFDQKVSGNFLYDPMYFGSLASTSTVDRVSRWFRFFRGSRRFMVVLRALPTNASGATPTHYWICSNLVELTGAVVTSPSVLVSTPPHSNNFEHRVDGRVNSFLEVSVPYYNPTDRVLIGSTLTSGVRINRMAPRFWLDYEGTFNTTPPVFDLYTAIGDDASFSFPLHQPF